MSPFVEVKIERGEFRNGETLREVPDSPRTEFDPNADGNQFDSITIFANEYRRQVIIRLDPKNSPVDQIYYGHRKIKDLDAAIVPLPGQEIIIDESRQLIIFPSNSAEGIAIRWENPSLAEKLRTMAEETSYDGLTPRNFFFLVLCSLTALALERMPGARQVVRRTKDKSPVRA